MSRLARIYANVVLVAAASWLIPQARAVATNWNTNSSGFFTAAANWDDGVPDSGDFAVFNRGVGVAYTVTFPGGSIFDPPPNYVISALLVHSNDVTFRDNSSPFTTIPSLTVNSLIFVGESGGEVAILNSSLSSLSGLSATIGRNAGAQGTLKVSAGTFSMSDTLRVADQGSGTLMIEAGGSVSNTNGIIGSLGGSSGSVTVTGAGSTWTNNGNLTVGDQGAGKLTIADGGEVVVTGSLLANTFGRVRLEGGKLTVNQFGSGGLDAFDWHSGTLRLTGTSGLTIASAGLFGPSLALDAGQNLEVDNTLTIDSGAELFASGGLTASSLINNGDLILSSTTVNGPVTNAAGANITAIGNVIFNDLVSGPGGFFGPGSVTFDGGMSPGASAAAVSFESDVLLGSTNTLEIELGGTNLGTGYDSLQVSGAATLDGDLDVSLIDSFSPVVGNSFEILHADGGIFGTFADTSLPALDGGLDWNVVYSNFAVLLQVAAAGLPGDYNQNGTVDAADYVVWRDNLGSSTSLANDDTPGVGPDDYARWRANFGWTAASGATAGPSSSANAAVPEPACAALMCLATAGIWIRVRSHEPKRCAQKCRRQTSGHGLCSFT